MPPDVIICKKPSHIPSIGPSDQPSGNPSFSMSVNNIYFPSITPTTMPSDAPIEKPSDKTCINLLQAPTGLPSLVQYIQASEFPTHVTSVYSIIRPNDGTYTLPISHTRLNNIVSLSQNPYEPPSAHFSPFLSASSPLHLTIHF